MNLSGIACLSGCLLFGAVMILASITDMCSRRIGNPLIVVLLVGYLALAIPAGLSWTAMLMALLAGVSVFCLGLWCFSRGWLGGGDVKLAAVAALWLGAPLVVPLIVYMTAIGAVLTVILLIREKYRAPPVPMPGELPYGPAIAMAGLLLLPHSPWFTGL